MRVKFWGTRGSIPVPGKDTIIYGGNTTCVQITLDSGREVIIDAGTGIRPLGEYLGSKEEQVDIHLLMTHIHWDHIMGFPFFSPIYEPTTRLRIDGYPSCMKGLRIPFDNRMGNGFFPISFNGLKAEIHYLDIVNRRPLHIDDVVIEATPLQHPQGGFGYRFREGEKTLVFITDNELTTGAWAHRHPEHFVRFCEGADILIHDAQYTPQERKKRRGWGHSDYEAVVNLAAESRVDKLILFHHDPSRKDPEVAAFKNLCEELMGKRGAKIQVDVAKEESEIRL